MREIEFSYIYQHGETGRIIDKRYDIEDIENSEFNADIRRCSLIARRQFTGLLDKHGVKIFEGDIMVLNKLKPSYHVVKYDDNCFVLDGVATFTEAPYFRERIVIGNMFENPELLVGD